MNRRLVLKESGKPLSVEVASIPYAPPNGAVVKVLYSGICHSDVHLWQGSKDPNIKLPLVLGHEICGTLHDVGQNVSDLDGLTIGSCVVVFPWMNCGICKYCQAGSTFCTAHPRELKQQGLYADGGFQNYVVVHDTRQLLPVPDNVPLPVAAISACSGLTSFNAVTSLHESLDREVSITGTARVLLVGAGGLCLWAISHLKTRWPTVTVCVADILKEKVDGALLAGADTGVVWDKADTTRVRAEKVMCAAGGRIDGSIDFTGLTESGSTIFRCLNKGATWAIVGLANGRLGAPSTLIAQNSIRVQGIYVGSLTQFKELLNAIAHKKVVPPRITLVNEVEVTSILAKLACGKQKGRAVLNYVYYNKL